MGQQRTTFDQFWALYTVRSRDDRKVTRRQLANHPVVECICDWPAERLWETAPRQMRRYLPALEGQLRAWLRELKAPDAIRQGSVPVVGAAQGDAEARATLAVLLESGRP